MSIWPATSRAPRRAGVLALAASGLLASCGQKGALILPGPDAATAVEEATPADADNEQERETNDARGSAQDDAQGSE